MEGGKAFLGGPANLISNYARKSVARPDQGADFKKVPASETLFHGFRLPETTLGEEECITQ
jgi:hypothetical protein